MFQFRQPFFPRLEPEPRVASHDRHQPLPSDAARLTTFGKGELEPELLKARAIGSLAAEPTPRQTREARAFNLRWILPNSQTYLLNAI